MVDAPADAAGGAEGFELLVDLAEAVGELVALGLTGHACSEREPGGPADVVHRAVPVPSCRSAAGRWHAVRTGEPQLAAAARGLLYQLGVSLAFLAPTRRDGGPRTHPICPLNHVTGRAFARTDPGLHANQALGELFLDTAMRTRTTGHGDPDPRHTICKAATTPDGG